MFVCLLAVFIARAAFASAIVPPWQGPDEPVHFSLTWLLRLPDGSWGSVQREFEGQVLRSMARHHWWQLYGVPTPDPLPSSFNEIWQQVGVGTYDQPLYYGLGAAILSFTRGSDLETAYWHLRILSLLLGAATLGFGWAGTRLLFDPQTAIGSTAVAVVHPQFLLTSLTVNPDIIAIVCGAIVWWQVGRIVRNRRPAFSTVLMLLAVIAALLAKRSAIPLAAVALIVLLALAVGRGGSHHRPISQIVIAAAAILGLVVVAIWQSPVQGPAAALVDFWSGAIQNRRPVDETLFDAVWRVVPASLENVWLNAGWQRHRPPEAWFWFARVLSVTSLAGAFGVLVKSRLFRLSLGLALGFLCAQVIGVYATAFRNVISPEGRLIFPVLFPACVVLWVGFNAVLPAPARPTGPVLLLGLLATLDLAGFALVLVPAFVP